MANPDRPKGFTPVRHINGGSWNNALAERCMPDDVDLDDNTDWGKIGIGDVVIATDEAAAATSGPLQSLVSVKPMVDEDTTAGAVGVYGVVVGIGAPGSGDTLNQESGPWDASDLTRTQITSAEVEADTDGFVLYVAPARNWIFEVQNDGAQTVQVGDIFDINISANTVAHTDAATGKSITELTGAAGGENCRVVNIPEYVDNETSLANARFHVMFLDPFGGLADSQ